MRKWTKIPTFPDYEISVEGFIRNRKTKRLRITHIVNGHETVVLSYKGKVYGRSVPKLIREVFGIVHKTRRGGITIIKPEEIKKEGYFYH